MTANFVNVKPIIVADAQDAHQVWLDVGCQHFTIGEYHETKAEAEWFAGQLETAIDEMLPKYVKQQADSLISDMEQQAKTFLNTENTEIFGWIKRLKTWQAALQGGRPAAYGISRPDGSLHVDRDGLCLWLDKDEADEICAGEFNGDFHGESGSDNSAAQWTITPLFTHPPSASDGRDAERFKHVIEYNMIATPLRCQLGFQDGNIESARAAIDRHSSAAKGEGDGR